MRAVIQKVLKASVEINGKIKSEIKEGLLILLGTEDEDDKTDIEYLSNKISMMRIFNDEKNVMNKSVIDIKGEILVVSQFTLMASTKKGNRPSYIKASKGEIAKPKYEEFCNEIAKKIDKKIKKGEFGADMKISLINDGPTTIIIDSKNKDI